MRLAQKGEWVQIHQIVLEPNERAPQVPDDTKAVPLELWIKGALCEDAIMGDTVEIETVTGRLVKGTLVSVNPRFTHDYGVFIPELKKAADQVKSILSGGVE